VLQPLFQYFQLQWLTAVPEVMWNVNSLNRRTNKAITTARGGTSALSTPLTGNMHPNIWKFINCMREEQVSVELILTGFCRASQSSKNCKYKSLQKCLHTLLKSWSDAIAEASMQSTMSGVKPGFHPNAIACVACVACVAFGWKPG